MFGSPRYSLLNGEIVKTSVFEIFLAKFVDAFDFPIGPNEAETSTSSNPLELGWESCKNNNKTRSTLLGERRRGLTTGFSSNLYDDEKYMVFTTDDVPMECTYAIMSSY
jgi:hypothetical protein